MAISLLFLGMERSRLSAREVAAIAVLATLSAVGRVTTGIVLCLQPTMFLVIITGFVMGTRAGFLVGAITPLVSNFLIGQGPWTPWQMLAWGLTGASAAWLKYLYPRAGERVLIVFCLFWGYLYGWLMNIWFWSVFVHPLTWQSFLVTCVASLGFDSVRALGNGLFCAVLGPGVMKILLRYRRKVHVSWLPHKE
ncbi:MAG: ECF transporter S component [Bacillota bacterium]